MAGIRGGIKRQPIKPQNAKTDKLSPGTHKSSYKRTLTKIVQEMDYFGTDAITIQAIPSFTMAQWLFICCTHLRAFALWSLFTILGLWGITLFSFEPKSCVVIEDQLARILSSPTASSDLNWLLEEIQALSEHKYAVWNEWPWDNVRQIITQHLPTCSMTNQDTTALKV